MRVTSRKLNTERGRERGTNVDVELADEAREIAVFEVFGQELNREGGWVRDNEAVISVRTP